MFPFKKTIFLVLAALCLSGSKAAAQMQSGAILTAPAQAAIVSESAFRLTNVTIGSQTFLLAQDYSNTSGEDDGAVADQCLVAMLNFFLEVPTAGKTKK